MQKVVGNIQDDKLKVYFVWLPILKSDNRSAAIKQSHQITDPRVTHYWDGDQVTGTTWQKVMEMQQIAWDMYFVYDESSEWNALPTKPDYFMHQLRGLPHENRFNKAKLEKETLVILKN